MTRDAGPSRDEGQLPDPACCRCRDSSGRCCESRQPGSSRQAGAGDDFPVTSPAPRLALTAIADWPNAHAYAWLESR